MGYDLYYADPKDFVLRSKSSDGFVLTHTNRSKTEVFDSHHRRYLLRDPTVSADPDWRVFFDPMRWPSWMEAPSMEVDVSVEVDEDLALPVAFVDRVTGDRVELSDVLVGDAARRTGLREALEGAGSPEPARGGQCRVMLGIDGAPSSAHWEMTVGGVSVYQELAVSRDLADIDQICRRVARSCVYVDPGGRPTVRDDFGENQD